MKEIVSLMKNITIVRFFKSFVVIILSIIIYNIVVSIINSSAEKSGLKTVAKKKKDTYLKLFKSIVRYIIILIDVLILLNIFGINITSMLAGVGIIGIIIGFAIQDALKDIIKGIDIITDSYYQVGDVIKYGDIVGRVLAIGLKTTKLEDVNSFNIVSISNRNIEQVEVVSNLINIDIPFSYDIALSDAETVISEIVDVIKRNKDIDNCEYRGVNGFADSAINYQIKVYCNPLKKVQIRRDSLRIILSILEKDNISIPYNQLDVHQK